MVSDGCPPTIFGGSRWNLLSTYLRSSNKRARFFSSNWGWKKLIIEHPTGLKVSLTLAILISTHYNLVKPVYTAKLVPMALETIARKSSGAGCARAPRVELGTSGLTVCPETTWATPGLNLIFKTLYLIIEVFTQTVF